MAIDMGTGSDSRSTIRIEADILMSRTSGGERRRYKYNNATPVGYRAVACKVPLRLHGISYCGAGLSGIFLSPEIKKSAMSLVQVVSCSLQRTGEGHCWRCTWRIACQPLRRRFHATVDPGIPSPRSTFSPGVDDCSSKMAIDDNDNDHVPAYLS